MWYVWSTDHLGVKSALTAMGSREFSSECNNISLLTSVMNKMPMSGYICLTYIVCKLYILKRVVFKSTRFYSDFCCVYMCLNCFMTTGFSTNLKQGT